MSTITTARKSIDATAMSRQELVHLMKAIRDARRELRAQGYTVAIRVRRQGCQPPGA